MTSKQTILAVFLVFGTTFSGLFAQAPQPSAPLGVGNVMALQGGPEMMDPRTMKFTFPIPVRHKAGAGGLDFDATLIFNADPNALGQGTNAGISFTNLSNVWTLGLTSGYSQPIIVASESIEYCGSALNGQPEYEYVYPNPVFQDKYGILRQWLWVFVDKTECNGGGMYFSGSDGGTTPNATDGGPIALTGVGSQQGPVFTVSYPDGTGQSVTMEGYAQEDGHASPPPSTLVLAQNANGTQITTTSAGTSVIDSLGQTVLTGMNIQNGAVNTWGTLSYQNNAGTQTYSVTPVYVSYTLSNLNCPGATETNYPGNLLDHVTMPDGRKYSFTYEASGYSNAVTGRLAKVTLPSGGSISYSYGNDIGCGSGAATLTRTVTDNNGNSSTWTYSGGTVVDPAGTKTVVTYESAYLQSGPDPYSSREVEASRQTYNSAGTLLSTVTTTYVGAQTNNPGELVLPIQSATTTMSLPGPSGVSSETYTAYNSVGLASEVDNYDFGTVGGPVGPLLSKVVMTYPQSQNPQYDYYGTPYVINPAIYPGSVTTYDGSGNKIHSSIPTYDTYGNLTQLQQWVSGSTYLTTAYGYDNFGNLDSVTDPNGAISYTHHTQCNSGYGYLGSTSATVKNPAGTTTATLATSEMWDCVAGVPTSITDMNGHTTTMTYNDPYFRITSSQDWLGNTTTYTYPTSSSNTSHTVLNFNSGNSTQDTLVTYDGLARPILNQTRQSPSATTFDTVSTLYDSYGRVYSTSLPYASAAGVVNSSIAKSTTTYDAFSRPLRVTSAAGGTTQYTYAANANDVLIASGPAPSGEQLKQRQLEYNALGQLTSVCEVTAVLPQYGPCRQDTSATGYYTQYTYDGDMLTEVGQNIQTGGQLPEIRTMSYDGLGRVLSETIPETGVSTFVYDSDSTGACSGSFPGDQIKSTDAAGNVTCGTYDNQHRMLTASVLSGGPYASVTPQLNYVYDKASLAGNTMQNVAGALAEAYTCTGSCTSKLTDVGFSTAAETSNGTATGRLQSGTYESTPHSGGYSFSLATTYPNGTLGVLSGNGPSYTMPSVTFGVDGEGRSTTATDTTHSLNLVTSTAYNVAGGPTLVSIGNGDSDQPSYDTYFRPTGVKFAVAGSSPFTVTGALTLNTNGSIKQMQITDTNDSSKNQTCTYSLDDLARLNSANCGSTWPQTFAYDPFGNINKTGTPPAMSYPAVYVPAPVQPPMTNRVQSGTTAAYDANGNQTTNTAGHFGWNAAAQMVSATIGGTTSQATYDALGRMVETVAGSTTTQFVYSPLGSQYAVVQNGSLLRGMVSLPGGDTAVYNSTGFNYLRRADWLGSSRLATTWGHAVYSKDAYAPYGEPYDETSNTDRSFTGQGSDLTQNQGIYDFQFRKLDTTAGRWLSPDPSGWGAVDLTDPQSLNRYSYVRNSPLSYVDPLGLKLTQFTSYDCTSVYQWSNAYVVIRGVGGYVLTASTTCVPVTVWIDVPDGDASTVIPGGQGTDGGGPGGGGISFAPKSLPAPNNPPQVPHTCQQNRILNAVPGSTLTNPNDTVGTSVGGHSQFGINVTTDQLSAAGFTPFNPFGHADGYHNGNVFFQVHDNGAGGIVTQGHIDVFNPATGLFGFLGHSIVDVGIGTLLQHLLPHSHGLLDPGC